MSLNYHRDFNDRSFTRPPWLVGKDGKLSPPSLKSKIRHEEQGGEVFFPICQYMEELTLRFLALLSCHRALKLMFWNFLQLPHAYFNGCTVWATQNGFNVCVTSTCYLAFSGCSRLDVTIFKHISQRCICKSLTFTTPQGDAVLTCMSTIASFLSSVLSQITHCRDHQVAGWQGNAL